MTEPITAEFILDHLRKMVESKQFISKEEWLGVACKLTLLRIDEARKLNRMNQEVAQKKLEIKQGQEKVNISAIDLEIQAKDEYRQLKDQEDLLYSLDEFVRVAKRASDTM